MSWKSEDEKSEAIERWLEGVSEEGTAIIDNQSVPSKRRTPHLQHLQPKLPLRTPSSPANNNNNDHQKHSNKMTGKKRLHPQRAASPSAKRRATGSDRKTRSMIPKAVHFSDKEAEARSEDSHTSSASARLLRDDLSLANPEVHFSSLEARNKPSAVTELFSNIVDKLEDSIPNSLRENVKALENGTPIASDMSNGDARLWNLAQETTSKTTMAFAESGDEGHWTTILHPLIESVMRYSEKDHVFAVRPIQNTEIGPPSLIPTLDGKPIAFKKIDLAIVFSEQNPKHRRLICAVRKDFKELCQSEEGPFRRFCQFAAIEIKSPDDSYYEASVQLGIWLAAGLEKTRELKAAANASQTSFSIEDTTLLPYVGIAVVGHVWHLHLGTKSADGSVQIYGPLVLGDTASTRGTFRVLAALNFLRDWGENVYYPWLLKKILLPLAGETDETESTAGPASGSGAVGKGKGLA